MSGNNSSMPSSNITSADRKTIAQSKSALRPKRKELRMNTDIGAILDTHYEAIFELVMGYPYPARAIARNKDQA